MEYKLAGTSKSIPNITMKMQRIPLLALFLLVAVGLGACGGSESNDASTSGKAAEVIIEPVGNQMKYATTEFSVEAGQEVTIIFNNTATSQAMSHNVVILQGDDEATIKRVGEAGLQAGPSAEYVPEDEAILANTPLAAPGETVEVTFTAPSEPGTYAFICTFPGHYVLMRGIMRVTA